MFTSKGLNLTLMFRFVSEGGKCHLIIMCVFVCQADKRREKNMSDLCVEWRKLSV